MKSGMDRDAGKSITDIDYLKQRLHDVICTPKGSIVGRRNFGSDFYLLIDRNVDSKFYMDAYISISDAINDPENGLDDFQLSEMTVQKVKDAHYEIILTGLFNNELIQTGVSYGSVSN